VAPIQLSISRERTIWRQSFVLYGLTQHRKWPREDSNLRPWEEHTQRSQTFTTGPTVMLSAIYRIQVLMKVTKHKKNLTFEDQKPQGSSGSTSNYWMWSCNNYTLYNKILNKIIKNYELDKLKTKEPISIKIKSQNANLWSFQTKDPHKH
jgi:hypothetical protein